MISHVFGSYRAWYIGSDVGLSREQLERKSRRQAESDFDQYGEKWAESFGSDRPFRPRFNELPEELQREAIRFIEEKNCGRLDDGFDEVA